MIIKTLTYVAPEMELSASLLPAEMIAQSGNTESFSGGDDPDLTW